MKPQDIQHIGNTLAIKWSNGREIFIPLNNLRRACPCAGCQGEVDIMGHLYKNPAQPLTAKAFELKHIGKVGSYGIQPLWADGHNTGIYTFDYLKQIAESDFTK